VSTANVELRAKVEHLARPESYPDQPLGVEVIETHFAWVFLAGRFVYKLKKPMRFHDFDFTTLATRRAHCELEVALNRRLAPHVYVGTVPLCQNGARLALGGTGLPVEWLVKMHRLPRDRSLDRMADAGLVDDALLRGFVERLARFYASAARAPWDGRTYRRTLASTIERTAAELTEPAFGLPATSIREIADALTAFTSQRADLLHGRVAAGRIVDAHGDLRPEHVFLVAPEPQVIDCLEFSAELRLLDSAAEIAFLALECERLGHGELARRILDLYSGCCQDRVAEELLAFYRAERAFVRAKLAAWHLDDRPPPAQAAQWRDQAEWYLATAAASLALDAAPSVAGSVRASTS
jgi:aminoglycoside phosphotransferase family enzyme